MAGARGQAGRARPERVLGWLCRLALSALLLAALARLVPVEEVVAALRSAAPLPIVAGMLLVVPKLLTAGLRLRALVRAQGLRLRLGQLIALNLITSFYSLLLPGQLVAGAVRWYKLAAAAGQPVAALAVIGFSRLIELEVTLALGLAFWLAEPAARAVHSLPALLVATALAACAAAHLLGPSLALRLAPHGGAGPLTRVRQAGQAVLEAIGRFRRLPWPDQMGAIGYAALTHLFGIATMVLFAWGLGAEIGVGAIGWVRSLMALLLLLPISWAGVGVREVSLALLLVPFGMAPGEAVALGVLLSLRALLEGAMGAVIEAFTALRSPRPAAPADKGPSPCASA